MNTKELIQKTIEDIWLNDIKKDYENNFIINEDTMKIAFCFHLRDKLTDTFLIENNIRILSEYRMSKFNQKVDIAIIEVKDERELFFHYSESTKSIIALIEMKFIPIKLNKLNPMLLTKDIKQFYNDLFKLINYGKFYENTLLFGAFIHEYYYPYDNVSPLRDILKFIENGILERLTELIGTNSESTQKLTIKVNRK